MDREIDRLYQLPLTDFTAARNDLAKSAGKDAGAVKALEKPSAPAWAVNQLYWKERRAYDRLIRASERIRAANAHALSGKNVDLAGVELEHRAAVKIAADAVRDILAGAGDPATVSTMKAVVDTLQALPGGGPPGRLAKPLAPLGFGVLSALMKGVATPRSLAKIVAFAPPRPKPDEVAEAARRAKEAARRRLRELDPKAAGAKRAAVSARAELDRATRARAQVEATLEAASADVARRRSKAEQAERDARLIEEERQRLRATLADQA